MIKRAQLVQYDSAKGLSVKYACSQKGEGVENVGHIHLDQCKIFADMEEGVNGLQFLY